MGVALTTNLHLWMILQVLHQSATQILWYRCKGCWFLWDDDMVKHLTTKPIKKLLECWTFQGWNKKTLQIPMVKHFLRVSFQVYPPGWKPHRLPPARRVPTAAPTAGCESYWHASLGRRPLYRVRRGRGSVCQGSPGSWGEHKNTRYRVPLLSW